MTDLETKLAEERERLVNPYTRQNPHWLNGFDVAAAIVREVVAEKDAEIARLEAVLSGFGYQHKLDVSTGERVWFKCVIAQPRKVTDAQREAIHEYMHHYIAPGIAAEEAIKYICAVFESTDEPAAK